MSQRILTATTRDGIDQAWSAYQAMCEAQRATPELATNHFWIKHRDRLWADWNRLFEGQS